MLKVKDIMKTEFATISENKKVEELLLLLVEKKINGVTVIDDSGKLVGMVTDGDIFRNLKPEMPKVMEFFDFFEFYMEHQIPNHIHETITQNIKDIMTRNDIITLQPEDNMEEVVSMFAKNRFKDVPVVNETGKVVGIITRNDVLFYIVKELLKK
jgi:CBS domain-containing protein